MITHAITPRGEGETASRTLLGTPEDLLADLARRIDLARIVTCTGVAKRLAWTQMIAAISAVTGPDDRDALPVWIEAVSQALLQRFGDRIAAMILHLDGVRPVIEAILIPDDPGLHARRAFDPSFREPTAGAGRRGARVEGAPDEASSIGPDRPRHAAERVIEITLPLVLTGTLTDQGSQSKLSARASAEERTADPLPSESVLANRSIADANVMADADATCLPDYPARKALWRLEHPTLGYPWLPQDLIPIASAMRINPSGAHVASQEGWSCWEAAWPRTHDRRPVVSATSATGGHSYMTTRLVKDRGWCPLAQGATWPPWSVASPRCSNTSQAIIESSRPGLVAMITRSTP
ncbi:hypothetical protein [Methylobacterium oxalidis]|nr:hypothetical protein [Methylobacterium oxalidis]